MFLVYTGINRFRQNPLDSSISVPCIHRDKPQAVNEHSYRTGEHYQAIYTKLYEQFKIPRYQDLPANKFEEAIKWLGGVHPRSGLSEEDLYKLSRLYCITDRMHHFICLITPALDSIASKYAENFHSMAFHYKRELNEARSIIKRETDHIQPKIL